MSDARYREHLHVMSRLSLASTPIDVAYIHQISVR